MSKVSQSGLSIYGSSNPEKTAEREYIVREQWVKAMEFRIVQEQLSKCQKTEGVNHYENCKEWSERYLDMLQGSKVS